MSVKSWNILEQTDIIYKRTGKGNKISKLIQEVYDIYYTWI